MHAARHSSELGGQRSFSAGPLCSFEEVLVWVCPCGSQPLSLFLAVPGPLLVDGRLQSRLPGNVGPPHSGSCAPSASLHRGQPPPQDLLL